MRIASFAICLLASSSALAQAPTQTPASPLGATAQGDLSVTIYSNDLALVQDVRQLDLPSGRSRQPFADVSATIRPETVGLSAPDVTVVEQNFDYDLLSPTSLMEKAVGETITLVRTNPGTGAETRDRAKVLAVNGGVVLDVGGKIEVLRDDGLPVRAIFDKVPDSLRARPTLSVSLDSRRAGIRPVTLSYLSGGLGWSADYVALFDEKAGTIDVQGWVTLRNTSGTSFVNAKTLLVAGEVGSGDEDGNRPYRPRPVSSTLRRAGTETAAREQLGDFYLYPLPERTTIADKQTKQVSFLDVRGAPAVSGYEYRSGWLASTERPESASSVLSFSNAAKGGLGDALPAGTVRVYMRDARGAAAIHRREPDRAYAAGLRAHDPHRRRLRREGPADCDRAREALRDTLAHQDALHAYQCARSASDRYADPGRCAVVVGRYAHRRRKPQERTARCRYGGVEGAGPGQWIGDSDRHVRNAHLMRATAVMLAAALPVAAPARYRSRHPRPSMSRSPSIARRGGARATG
jgi:hypothetical protein